ncbi:MAG TPA: hypothetical protein VD846_02370 [Allosphingosinicella sp.]|nr:hypothetical protein [Allosphingosinicella sp.]
MTLGRRHLLFALAFLAWGAAVLGALGIVGAILAPCVDPGYGHGLTGCRKDIELATWAVTLAVLIGGAWLLKRLAIRLGIDLDRVAKPDDEGS